MNVFYIIMDGISNPSVFGWESFLFFEVMTLLIEGIIMFTVIDFDKPISKYRAICMLFAMNILSSALAVPFWLSRL